MILGFRFTANKTNFYIDETKYWEDADKADADYVFVVERFLRRKTFDQSDAELVKEFLHGFSDRNYHLMYESASKMQDILASASGDGGRSSFSRQLKLVQGGRI